MEKLVYLLTIMSLSMALLVPLRGQCQVARAAATSCHAGTGAAAACSRSCGGKAKAAGKRKQQPQVEGMFVFGSSLVDNGNNFLNGSGVRADYLPYGVDFLLGPSGRFSNGRNVINALGELLGLPGLVPPFAAPRTRRGHGALLRGVDFASGGSGILDKRVRCTRAATD